MDSNTKKVLLYLLDKVDPEWVNNEEIYNLFITRRFTPPTTSEVTRYLQEQNVRNPKECAERFCNFYQSKGWMIGKNKMKDWKSAVRTWKFDKNNLIL